MDGAGLGPFYCLIHYMKLRTISGQNVGISMDKFIEDISLYSSIFIEDISQPFPNQCLLFVRGAHKTLIGFLMKSFHFRWNNAFNSSESLAFPGFCYFQSGIRRKIQTEKKVNIRFGPLIGSWFIMPCTFRFETKAINRRAFNIKQSTSHFPVNKPQFAASRS